MTNNPETMSQESIVRIQPMPRIMPPAIFEAVPEQFTPGQTPRIYDHYRDAIHQIAVITEKRRDLAIKLAAVQAAIRSADAELDFLHAVKERGGEMLDLS
jgi:hypothetical protein